MNVSGIAKRAGKVLSDNSPAILAGVAVTGTVSTAILASKGTIATIRDYDDFLNNTEDPYLNRYGLSKTDLVRRYWKNYIPAAATGLATVGCIIGATAVSNKRQAALISAYSLTEKAFSEFKEKAIENLGPKKTQAVFDDIARDRMEADPASKSEVIIMNAGKQLCYESFTGRYFESDVQTIRKAQNDMNTRILNEMYVSMNDFHEAIGLTPTRVGEELGFAVDNQLDVQFSSMMTDDERPCINLGYAQTPIRDFYKLS